jgi:glycosyltransferase involved in cell wall biosynthesis
VIAVGPARLGKYMRRSHLRKACAEHVARSPRLLMLLHGYFPDEPRVAAEARAAIGADWEVDIIALRRAGEASTDLVEGVRLRRLPVQHRRGAGLAATIREYLSFTILAAVAAARLSLRRRYDVIQVHNPPDFLVLAALVPRLLGTRILFDVHDLASDMFEMRFERSRAASLAAVTLRRLEWLAARLSSAVVTVHEPYRNELAARGVPRDKITVVMNSLDERLLPPPLALEEKGFRVVYHGTVTPHYGVKLLVEAAGQLRESVSGLRVDIYGEGDAKADLELRARELGLEHVVRLTGHLPQREVLRAVQGASVGVVPNLPTRLNRFALSTKLFEYVALGIPVVSADLPTIKEHFSDDEVLFFRAGDASSLAHALAEIARDPYGAARRVEAARRRYEDYRWVRSAAEYVDLIRRLTARPL